MTKRPTLLIVEDEGIIALALEGRVAALGFDVVGRVSTGEAAVDVALAKRPDVILMDIRLAGRMDGIEAAMQIVAVHGAAIVFVTAYADEATMVRADAVRPAAYVAKPFGAAALAEALRVAVSVGVDHPRRALVVPSSDTSHWLPAEALDAAPILLVRLQRDGRVSHVNACFERITEWPVDEARGREWLSTFLRVEDRERMRLVLDAALTGVRTSATTSAVVTRTGAERVIEWRLTTAFDATGQPSGVVAAGLDVTERARAEALLREREAELARSREQLAETQRVAQIGSWELDLSTNAARWSEQLYRIMEVDLGQTDGLFEAFLARIHPDDRARGMARFQRAIADGTALDDEARLVMPDGRIKHVRQRAEFMQVHHDDAGRPTRMVGTIEDVTAQALAAQALRESRVDLEGLLAASPVGVFRVGPNGDRTFVNARWREITGLTSEEAAAEGWSAALHPDDREGVLSAWRRASTERLPFRREYRFLRADGVETWVLGQGVPLRDPDGAHAGHIATLTDITELRQAQAAAQAERARLRAIIDVFPGVLGLYTVDGDFVDANARSHAMTRRARNEPVAQKVWDLPHYASSPELRERVRDAFARGRDGEAVSFELKGPAATGAILELEASFCPVRDSAGKVTHIAAFGVDLSARNEALARSRESEQRLNEAQRLAKVGSWELDLATSTLTWSDEVFRIFEIDAHRFAASYDAFLALVHPEDREWVDASYRKSLETREPYTTVHRLLMPDGRVKHLHERGQSFWDESGRAVRSWGTVQDVTEERNLRVALQEAKTRLEHTLASIIDGFFTLDTRDWTYTYINPAGAQMMGRTVEQLTGRCIWEEFPEAVGTPFDLAYRRVASERVPLVVVEHHEPLDRWLEASIYPMDGAVSVYVRDVTTKRRAQLALEASEARFRSLMEQAADAIFIADTDASYLDVNPAACELVGYSRDELLRMNARELLTDPVAQGLDDELPTIRAGDASRRTWQMRRKDGKVIDVEANIKLLSDGRVIGLTRDISKRKELDRDLRSSLARLRNVMDSLFGVVAIVSLDGTILDTNRAPLEASGVTPEVVLGKKLWETEAWSFAPAAPEEAVDAFERARQGEVVRYETQVRGVDGQMVDVDVVFGPVRDAEDRIVEVVAFSVDITSRKRAERVLRDRDAEIRASLAEKEMLLREIHHRVKNNLQIILSLVHFQAQKLRLPDELTALTELRQRILAMVLVHERLYLAHDVARVDLGDYVRTLVAGLGRSFESGQDVRIDVMAEEVPLPIELALPCGMILCELVTNVIKYAFPTSRGGRAKVAVRADGDLVILAVDDEGVGFPDGFDPETSTSFGWELIRTLVLQLDGTVEASSDHGAHVSVSFPAPRAP